MRLTQRKVGLCNNDQWMAKPVIPQSIGKSSLSSQRALRLSLSLMRPSHGFSNFSAPGSFWLPKKKSYRITVLFGDWIACNISICSKQLAYPYVIKVDPNGMMETAGDCWSVPSERRAVLNSRFLRVIVGSMAAHDIPTPIWIWFPVGSFHPLQGHRVPPFTESMNLNGHRASHLLSPWQSWSMG